MSTDVQIRRNELLKIIVKEYISTAVPVASESLLKQYKLNVSSATIRNDMAALEDEGFITRPHTSAGCIPLDKGYRFYVESLSQNLSLEPDEQTLIKDSFDSIEEEIERWLKLSAMLISRFAGNAALVTFPKANKNRFKHIELVSLHDFLVLLILVFSETTLRQQFISFKDPINQDQLTAISNKLNSIYSGLTATEIKTKAGVKTAEEKKITDIILDIMNAVDEIDYSDFYLEGLRSILSQPEFTNKENMLRIMELLESRKGWLTQMVTRKLPSQKIQVIIGEESNFEESRDLSLVLGRYGIPHKMSGTIGVIGPTRMDYSRAISSVGYISQLLSFLLSEVYSEN